MGTTASWVGGGSAAGSSITATMLNRAGMGQAPTGHAEHKSADYKGADYKSSEYKGGLGLGKTHPMTSAGSSSSSHFRDTIGGPIGSSSGGGMSHGASYAGGSMGGGAGGGAGGGRPMDHISERQQRAMEDQALGKTTLIYTVPHYTPLCTTLPSALRCTALHCPLAMPSYPQGHTRTPHPPTPLPYSLTLIVFTSINSTILLYPHLFHSPFLLTRFLFTHTPRTTSFHPLTNCTYYCTYEPTIINKSCCKESIGDGPRSVESIIRRSH